MSSDFVSGLLLGAWLTIAGLTLYKRWAHGNAVEPDRMTAEMVEETAGEFVDHRPVDWGRLAESIMDTVVFRERWQALSRGTERIRSDEELAKIIADKARLN